MGMPTNPALSGPAGPRPPTGLGGQRQPGEHRIVDIPRRHDGDGKPDLIANPNAGRHERPPQQHEYHDEYRRGEEEFPEQAPRESDDYATIVEKHPIELNDDERRDLEILLYVGRRAGEIKILGHRIEMETLNAADEMAVGLFVKPYVGTPGYARAYSVAQAAAGIRKINGKPVYQSLAPIEDESELFSEKVKIMARHYPFTITPIYDHIQVLDAEFAELAAKLGKRYG